MPPISYTKGFANWEDKPSTATKTTAAKYNNFETGIAQLYELYNAAGDLGVGAGADQLDRLAAPTVDNHVLVADTAQTLKMKWAAVPTGGLVPLSLIDASGDLIVGSGADAATRLARGANDEVLSVNSNALDYRKVVNAMVDDAAGIVQSKISFTGWQGWTPALTASSSNPTLGSGAVTDGRYFQIGSLVIAVIDLRVGTTSWNAGSGTYSFSVPIARSASQLPNMGFGLAFDGGGSDGYIANVQRNSGDTSKVNIRVHTTGDAPVVTHAVPVAWGQNTQFLLTVVYEV
jgi:hypothetical protein